MPRPPWQCFCLRVIVISLDSLTVVTLSSFSMKHIQHGLLSSSFRLCPDQCKPLLQWQNWPISNREGTLQPCILHLCSASCCETTLARDSATAAACSCSRSLFCRRSAAAVATASMSCSRLQHTISMSEDTSPQQSTRSVTCAQPSCLSQLHPVHCLHSRDSDEQHAWFPTCNMSDCCCVAAAIRPGFAFHRAAREAVRLSSAASAAVAA